ncbi:hypothetical protein AXF42_Ash018390 [Apostasia shenzhenica]|uniref:Uncharacterized protein n=1 Tax=Apostasia shenzhenica TaxID=1088818 RepID=A0A2I0BE78_9ASPA|nr:hypothetical protein AXF42_Ash018390 [Apostasia shenzhenica]
MAAGSAAAALILSLAFLAASAQPAAPGSGSFDISKQPGFEDFVREATKATGHAPKDMNAFIDKVNRDIAAQAGGAGLPLDPALVQPALVQKARSADRSAVVPPAPANAPANSPSNSQAIAPAANGASSVGLAGLTGVLVLAAAACFA